jgi:hypothetical protein
MRPGAGEDAPASAPGVVAARRARRAGERSPEFVAQAVGIAITRMVGEVPIQLLARRATDGARHGHGARESHSEELLVYKETETQCK